MALRSIILCELCDQKKEVWHPPSSFAPKICDDCKKKKADAKRAAYLDSLAKLSVEERLSRIEKWIYDYKPPVNIRDVRF